MPLQAALRMREANTISDPVDFDYFGKGIDGYVQYMQTFDQANKPDEPVSHTDEDMQSEFYVPDTAPVKPTSPSTAFHPVQQVKTAPEKSMWP